MALSSPVSRFTLRSYTPSSFGREHFCEGLPPARTHPSPGRWWIRSRGPPAPSSREATPRAAALPPKAVSPSLLHSDQGRGDNSIHSVAAANSTLKKQAQAKRSKSRHSDPTVLVLDDLGVFSLQLRDPNLQTFSLGISFVAPYA